MRACTMLSAGAGRNKNVLKQKEARRTHAGWGEMKKAPGIYIKTICTPLANCDGRSRRTYDVAVSRQDL